MLIRSTPCPPCLRWLTLCAVALTSAGCLEDKPLSSGTPSAEASDQEQVTPQAALTGCTERSQIVSLRTEDALTLEADLHTTGDLQGPIALLLHEVPPFSTRANYKQPFIDRLLAAGVSVLNLDRRGAGNSEGDPVQAYTGPNGKLDAQAALSFLADNDCAFDFARFALIGASNGTTTALDFTLESSTASAGGTFAKPSAMVFLTGGTYTETQNQIAAQHAALDSVPLLFVYSTLERAWSVGFEPTAPTAWEFAEFAPGAHGTAMFDANPEAMDRVTQFVTSRF